MLTTSQRAIKFGLAFFNADIEVQCELHLIIIIHSKLDAMNSLDFDSQ